MKKQIIVVGIILVLLAVGLTGCNDSSNDKNSENNVVADEKNAPVATDDIVTVEENSINNKIDVLDNDMDPDSDTISISSAEGPQNGTIAYTSSYIYYTPASDFHGDDQFYYIISDGRGGNDNGTVYITVMGGNIVGRIMTIKEYIDDQIEDTDWSTYYTRLQETLDDGDTLNIKDKISIINYNSENDETCITLCKQEGYTSYCDSFYFKGDITQQYQKEDIIIITIHIKHVIVVGTNYNYNLEIFEEQWESENYFNSHVSDFSDVQDGLKPMSPSIITKSL